jgi:glyoxylase-like metal-dependent hydrolase (beta-lactamase superfamily II)/rhodanese-related sulfurtransferase
MGEQTDRHGRLYLRQYYLGCLSHASYLVGDLASGRAVVVDPQRDVGQYLADAAAEGLAIDTVIETHFHADFLSGHLELAEQAGARIVYGRAAEGRTEFPITAMGDGERIDLGGPDGVELEILETPGHTPESISVVVRERPGAVPHAVLTGDTLFIGDVGRPDLLSAVGESADGLARQLYRSLRTKLMPLPPATLVYPAHGAGSACGKHLSTDTVSTIGDQLRTNYALAPMDEDAFVDAVTEGQAAAPMYFLSAALANRREHGRLDEAGPDTSLDLDALLAAQAAGAVVLDTRDPADFANGHLDGSVNVGLGGRFADYTGEVVAAGTPIAIVADPGHGHEAVLRLARIGFDDVAGVFEDLPEALLARPELARRASRLSAADLAERREHTAVQLVDVRAPGETASGMLDGARNVPLAELVGRVGELDPSVPTVVYCAGGYRSSIAASVLRAHGFADVSDLLGGYGAACPAPG